MEYTVFITGKRGLEKLTASIVTKAESPQMAILQVSGLSSQGFLWYSWTYRQEVGYADDVAIVAYEVGE